MSPRDDAAVADNRLMGDREKVDVSGVQPRSSGNAASFEAFTNNTRHPTY
jgi:hypothetical protein